MDEYVLIFAAGLIVATVATPLMRLLALRLDTKRRDLAAL